MYYLVYGFLYLISLLPFWVLYFISDVFYGLTYYVVGYRKNMVMDNLKIAFPEKTEKERIQIAKKFYHHFIDTFIETIKLLSINEKELRKRFSINIDEINALYDSGQNLLIVSAHFFNWEIANAGTSLFIKYPLLTAYIPVKNKAFDKLIYNLRTRFRNAVLINATNFRREVLPYLRKRYALGLVADQKPAYPRAAYWIPFFGRLTPFVKGPEKMSKGSNTAVAYLHFYPVNRGYYNLHYQVVTTAPNSFKEGMLAKRIVEITEDCIRKQPAVYLWSHNRWKWQFNEEAYGDLVVK
ncbi:MAG: lipid A biosynthesis acyltransferase [Chitinophagaceae bacterium]|nr:lipid A biosynthesis acyltransferase [Chitinophagaceae bacterium]